MKKTKRQKQYLGWWALFTAVVIILVGIWFPVVDFSYKLIVGWLIIAAAIGIFLGKLGKALGKSYTGIFIDPQRNRVSLSRMQVIVWTLVILSSIAIIMLGRISDAYVYGGEGYNLNCNNGEACNNPVDIEIPTSLIALMGISLTSAVASPFLKKQKMDRSLEEEGDTAARSLAVTSNAPSYTNTFEQSKALDTEEESTSTASEDSATEGQTDEQQTITKSIDKALKLPPKIQSNKDCHGVMVMNKHWRHASMADIFMGEEVSNYHHVDIAKVQNFFFSLISILAYVFAIAHMLQSQDLSNIQALPDFSDGMVTLVGLSHGGYLVDKSFTHASPTKNS